MKFTIISLNDERIAYKNVIRERVQYPEVFLDAVDGRLIDVDHEFAERGLTRGSLLSGYKWSNAKRGELGVWLSNYDRWLYAMEMDEPLIVFEDDAVPHPLFNQELENLMTDLPDDWDVFTLWVPENQRVDYFYEVQYDEHGHPAIAGMKTEGESYYYIGSTKIAKAYQGYGMVAQMYSPKGARKLFELAHYRGVDNPVDCWVFEEIHKGKLNGYAPRTDFTNIVGYDWQAVSHVQLTERVP